MGVLDRDDARLLVLLLPERLEAFALRPGAEALLRAPGAVAVDPPRASYGSLARIPDAVGVSLVTGQARRLRRRLPGRPGAVAIFEPGQYPLARGLLASEPGCELWYGPVRPGEAPGPARGRRGRRLQELQLLAAARATVTFDPGDPGALSDRLAALGLGRPEPHP